MDYIERSQIIERGKALFNSNVFPNEFLENVTDKRIRADLCKSIFTPKDLKPFNEATQFEKITRGRQLKIPLEFINYLHALDRTKPLGYIYFLVGVIVLAFAIISSPDNLSFALITISEGIALIIILRNAKNIITYHRTVLYLIIILLLLEFSILNLPDPVLTISNLHVLESKRGTIVLILNQISPYIYLMLKSCIPIFLTLHLIGFAKFNKLKVEFEN